MYIDNIDFFPTLGCETGISISTTKKINNPSAAIWD